MKILLLNPCDGRSLYKDGTTLFGLLAIGAYLKKQGHWIKGIDLTHPYRSVKERYLESPRGLIEKIRQFNPDICCISVYTETRYNAYYWAKQIKKINKDTVVVLGGVHASAEPASILEDVPEVDFIVIGEGEITMVQLADSIARRSSFEEIDGIAFRKDGQVKITTPREPVEDIDSLPVVDRMLFLEDRDASKVRFLEMMAGRGCPWRCKFCTSAFFWKGRRRVRSAANIIKELEQETARFPNIKFIRFWDESLLANKDLAFEVMKALKKIGLPWECWARTCDINEEVVKAMKDAGCWRVRIGIETGSKGLMRALKKPINLDQVPEKFALMRKYKLKYSPSFILGLPGSSAGDVYDTLNLIRRIKTDPASCTISMSTFLFPGTDYFEDFKEKNPDFRWQNTPEKYKGNGSFLDIRGNVLFPVTGLPKDMPNWKCHLLYVKSTLASHPLSSTKRMLGLGGLAIKKVFYAK